MSRLIKVSYSLGHVGRSLTPAMDFSNLWKHCYGFTHASFHTGYTWLTASAASCPAALSANISVFDSHMQVPIQ